MAMLFDLDSLDEATANYSLECMCKSLSEPPPGDDGIWSPHESVFLRTLVEAFTQQGQNTFAAMATSLEKWLSGAHHIPGMVLLPGPGPHWPIDQLPRVAAYLASKAPGTMALSDLNMLVDYLLQVHLPPSFAATHAEWLTARAAIMGKLEASAPGATLEQADNALAAMPNTIAQVAAAFTFTPLQQSVMEYGAARCAESIVSLTDSARHRMKSIILVDAAERLGGGPVGPGSSLQTKLFDSFGDLNRDWRRIAITEAGEVANQGFVSSMQPGSRLKRMEHYRGACGFCSRIDGKIFDVVDPSAPEKDGKTQVWVGKTNLGRSASPRKKFMGVLIHRSEDELWWPSAGLQHPHCRGRWVLQGGKLPGDDPDPRWSGWMTSLGV